ncbi:MAG: alcohol dehydrogenase catalytic domain-containing protein, partial [Chthoniobacteraceae bacterium]
MKAIRISAFGGPEVLQLADVPDPQPEPGQIVVRMAAAGVNPVETYIRAGTYAKLPPLPCGIGLDGAGVVEAVGDGGGSRLQPGQRVWVAGSVSGTYAELALCDAVRVHPLPAGVTFEQGAALGVPCSTAYR